MKAPTDRARFANWVELHDQQYPIARSPFLPPLYTEKTILEPVEPWATQYQQQSWELPDECHACDGPDPTFYTPTPLLIELQDRLAALHRKAFREVPNPDYDPVRAAAYWAKQRERRNQTKITIGQSYSPDIP